MWIVLKLDTKKYDLFLSDLKKRVGDNFSVYRPKMKVEKYLKNRLVEKSFLILNNYIFCFHKDFIKPDILKKLKFTKGVKEIIDGYILHQKEISSFVNKLQGLENKFGYLTGNLFSPDTSKQYKFCSGPFTQKLFKIINFNKNNFFVDLGNVKTLVNTKKVSYFPI